MLMLVSIQAASAEHGEAGVRKKNSAATANTFSRNKTLPKWADPLQDIAPAAHRYPVVMRLAETQAWVGDKHAVLLNRAIEVNEQSALGVIGQFGIDYFPAYQKLQLHRVALLRGGQVLDRTMSVGTRLLDRETRIDAGMVGGAVTLQLLLDDVRVGDTLWITYTVEGSNPVFGKRWSDDFSWDAGVPVEHRSLTVFHPRERPVYWRLLGDVQRAALVPSVSVHGEIEKLRFEQRSLDAVELEESSPGDYIAMRYLQLSEYRDWNGVAIWADGLFPQVAASPALKALAQQLRKEPTPAGQASAALRWVQDEIRYFSVSIGENSHRPQAPDTVLRRRYGDCKDKSYLLVSLLNELGVRARPVLINARAPKAGARMIASPAWFDHVIVQIELDGRHYYVDPTASGQKVGLDKLTTVFEGGAGLLVDRQSRELTILPERTDVGPEYEHRDSIVIAGFDGDAVLEARVTYRGRYAEAMRAAFPRMSATEFAKTMLERYESLYPGVTLIEPPRVEDDLDANAFILLGRYKLPGAVHETDDNYVIDYESHVFDGSLGLPRKIVRSYPLALPKGQYAARYRLQIQWPDKLRVNQKPEVRTVDNPFFSVRDEFAFKGSVVDYMLDYRIKQEVVPASEVPDLQAQTKLLTPYVSASFRIAKAALIKPEAAAMSLSLRELDVLQTIGGAQAALRSVDAGKETPEAIGQACDMVVSGYRLRELMKKEVEGMVQELERVLRKESTAPAALCLARLSYERGRFADSISFYQRAQLPDDSPYRRDLAWAQAYAGDGDAAVATMLAYRAARGAAGTSIAAGLALADEIALAQRAGKPVPADLLRLASEMPDGVWPRPLLAMQVGALGADALLERIRHYPADKRELALNDSWFYIGQQKLLAKDRSAAKRAFLWYGVDGLRSSALYGQAQREIHRLANMDKDYYLAYAAFSRDDIGTAIAKWRASAQAGVAASQFEMGTVYRTGKYLPQDYAQARHYFELAAAQDNEDAITGIAHLYWHGGGVPVDFVAANRWYAKAADMGSADAAYNLAFSYQAGKGIEQDMQKAFFYFRIAAERNMVDAQSSLAAYYMDEAMRDYAKALRWASRAAAQGDEPAILILANIYRNGLGVPKDEARATSLYLALDKTGSAATWSRLGNMYAHGRGVEQDYSLAFHYYQKGHTAGSMNATNNLADLYEKGHGVAQDYAKALSLYRQAAKAGNATSMFSLAELYEKGLGVTADPVLSYTYCKLSLQAKGNFADYCARLAAVLKPGQVSAADAFALGWKEGAELPAPGRL